MKTKMIENLETQTATRPRNALAARGILGMVFVAGFLVMWMGGCASTNSPTSSPSPATSSDRGTQAASGVADATSDLGIDATFWQTWGDGQAELTSYAFKQPRYGSVRDGTAVAIFVTENFSLAERVKSDSSPTGTNGVFPVMKLNLVEDFQTGIYDYNLMTSVFVALKPVDGRSAGSATKVSFSSQEWCGQVYQQLVFGQYAVTSTLHSYFAGEADKQEELPAPRDGLSEDALMHWARRMAQPLLEPGQTRSVSLLRSLKSSRFQHQPVGWREAKLSRSATVETVTVPGGTFDVEVYRAEIQGGPTRTYFVERATPHRIIKWLADDGESAEMLKSIRAKYWQMNDPESESKLSDLGLERRSPRTM